MRHCIKYEHSALSFVVYAVLITLKKILQQIQQTAINSQRALSTTKATQASKERERRILQLTIDEISTLENDVNLYKGVGKMYAL